MPELFVNPGLSNYFVEAPEANASILERSYVPEYEAGKVITFPNVKIDIDFDFWSTIDLDMAPELKKFRCNVDGCDLSDVDGNLNKILKSGVDDGNARKIIENMRSVYEQIIPIYRSIFSGYDFIRHKSVWRLNTIMNENMHVDTYKGEDEQHLARMFVNLDNQPRIWQTSWHIDEMCEMNLGKIRPEKLESMTRGEIWAEISKATFGRSSLEWWDNQPRHVSYFNPGDIWIVDSRQISHQIFYGRRALSIDFAIAGADMQRPERHYLNLAEQFRTRSLERA